MATPPKPLSLNTLKPSGISASKSLEGPQKNGKRESLDPQSLPARNSSLKTRALPNPGRSPRKQKQLPQPKIELDSIPSNATPQDDEKPPTPPPKNHIARPHRPRAEQPVPIPPPKKKKGFLNSFVRSLASCCAPSAERRDEPTLSRRNDHIYKQSVEMDSLKKEDDRPTQSTIGVSSTEEEPEAPPVPSKTPEPEPESPKPTVTISPDAFPEKPAQQRIQTPILQPVTDDEESDGMTTDDEREREKEIRRSLQLQSPFPPAPDEVQSDALMVSPAPQISLQQSTDSEESDVEDIPRPINAMIDEPQPRVPSTRFVANGRDHF